MKKYKLWKKKYIKFWLPHIYQLNDSQKYDYLQFNKQVFDILSKKLPVLQERHSLLLPPKQFAQELSQISHTLEPKIK